MDELFSEGIIDILRVFFLLFDKLYFLEVELGLGKPRKLAQIMLVIH